MCGGEGAVSGVSLLSGAWCRSAGQSTFFFFPLLLSLWFLNAMHDRAALVAGFLVQVSSGKETAKPSRFFLASFLPPLLLCLSECPPPTSVPPVLSLLRSRSSGLSTGPRPRQLSVPPPSSSPSEKRRPHAGPGSGRIRAAGGHLVPEETLRAPDTRLPPQARGPAGHPGVAAPTPRPAPHDSREADPYHTGRPSHPGCHHAR